MNLSCRTWVGVAFIAVAVGCAKAPAPRTEPVGNTRPPREVVVEHLRAAEAGDWAAADALVDADYRMQMKGMPFFVSIPKSGALDMHKARKQAFPDFRFNEQVLSEDRNAVKVAVYLTGTHTGRLDYPIDAVPKADATGRTIDLPAEYFTWYVERDRIVRTYGEIPDGHGPPALKAQLGLE